MNPARRAPVFRDPPSTGPTLAEVSQRIAHALLGAPQLPVAIPAFGMTLLNIEPHRDALDLVVGLENPVGRLRLTRLPGTQTLAVEVHGDVVAPERFAPILARMATRLQEAVEWRQWQQAHAHAAAWFNAPERAALDCHRQMVEGVGEGQGLVRTGFRCNQNCGLCWQDRQWGAYPPEQILTWIEDLANAGGLSLILSGGEPTLDPALLDYIAAAKRLGFREVLLETNAIQCAKPGFAARLREAGLSSAFVSLHSPDPAISDAITRAPGTHKRTVAGVKALLAAGLPVRLNAVMTQEGFSKLAELPAFIVREFGANPQQQPALMLSYPSRSFDPALDPSILPEPSALRAALTETVNQAFVHGVKLEGLDGPSGPPLCAFGADRRVTTLEPRGDSVEFRLYLPACAQCAVRDACFGVRQEEVQLYGDACVQPFAVAPPL